MSNRLIQRAAGRQPGTPGASGCTAPTCAINSAVRLAFGITDSGTVWQPAPKRLAMPQAVPSLLRQIGTRALTGCRGKHPQFARNPQFLPDPNGGSSVELVRP